MYLRIALFKCMSWVIFFLIEKCIYIFLMNTFIQQGHIKLIKNDFYTNKCFFFFNTTSGYKSDALSIRPRLPQSLSYLLWIKHMT